MALDDKLVQRLQNKDASLVELDFTRAYMRDSEFKILLEFLASPHKLQTLILDFNRLNGNVAKQVLTTIAKYPCPTLTTLSLKNCFLYLDDADAINAILKGHKLVELNLGYNNFGNDGVQKIVATLHDDDSLQQLNLQGNKMSADGIESVAELIEHNTTLEKVYLLGNDIYKISVERMLTALKSNTTLTECDFISTKVGRNWRDFEVEATSYLERNVGGSGH